MSFSGRAWILASVSESSACSGAFPDKAFDFAIAHRAEVDALIEPTSRTSYFGSLASGSLSPEMEAKLKAFAETVPASARPAITRTIATINVRLDIIRNRLPEADRWLATHPG